LNLKFTYIYRLLLLASFSILIASGLSFLKTPRSVAKPLGFYAPQPPPDTPEVILPYPFGNNNNGGLYLNQPENIKSGYEYDPETGNYNYKEKYGDYNFRPPSYLTFDEYLKYDYNKRTKEYWREKSGTESDMAHGAKGLAPTLKVESEAFDRIFGGDKIEIRPNGSAELIFGVNSSRRDNPAIPERQRRVTTFDFDQRIQLSVIGQIGDKLRISTNYNTQATFDFENQMKLEYTGYEDEIIQKIEAGNVALPVKGSLITGSQTLFGIKSELKFGRLRVTTVLSQEKGEKKEIEITGGAQIQEFEKNVADYEANKHFFLSQFFRDQYESALSNPPLISSRITVNRVEIWVSNVNRATDNIRNVIAMQDLGEATLTHIHRDDLTSDNDINSPIPDNNANNLYSNLSGGFPNSSAIRSFTNASVVIDGLGFVNGLDYEVYENARMLSSSEYILNPQLGYVSLNSMIGDDDIVAVAYQYTYNGKTYQVGEFSTDGINGQNALYLKLLKSTILNTKIPNWNLMMKNVYSLGAFNVGQKDFLLDIWYLNPETGVEIPFLPEGSVKGKPIIMLTDIDRLNQMNQPGADGVFDFMPNITINPNNGRVYFPVLEPFGSDLRKKFSSGEIALANKFAFDSLYSTTQALAKLDAPHNRYVIKGQYSSSSGSEISLNALNIPQGSVVVTAGGSPLAENVDYTVDYNLGRVKIINTGLLQSGQPIKVSLQSNALFAVQVKTMVGTRLDYKFNENLSIGSTILRLAERPMTQKINIGNEPIANTVVGLDATYTKEAPIITRIADKLPFYSTKEKSSVTVQGEFAYLIPGNSRAITREGIAYVDDFEGSQSAIDIKAFNRWRIASTPQKQPDLFPEGNLSDNLAYGYNRAKLAWYVIDPLFWRIDSRTPAHIKDDKDMRSNHYMRQVDQLEVFPNKSLANNVVTNIPVLDLAYYPEERGPYNFDALPSAYSSGTNMSNGLLNNPTSRWGGIMRDLQTTDFEASNIEFIQFWLMDPFDPEDGNTNHSGGDLYINLGSISEDILRDNRKSFENGLPTSTNVNTPDYDYTSWGRVAKQQPIIYAFDNQVGTREFQDIGLDGLNDAEESEHFKTFYNSLSPAAQQALNGDIASDNYRYYRGTDYDNDKKSILDRYKKYNNFQGNSAETGSGGESYPTSATTLPDVEDINLDNNQDRKENYYQYQVRLSPQDLDESNIGKNYITNIYTAEAQTPNGTRKVRWYQFKIPIRMPDKTVGDIYDFKAIRFMRMFVKGFSQPIVLRFATLDLIRGEWRKYEGNLLSNGEYIPNDEDETTFNIGAVNVEENSEKQPVPYVLPPGIERQLARTSNSAVLQQLNEQSLAFNVCNLKNGDARASFKNLNLDIRQYKRLKMFIHAEQKKSEEPLNDDDLSVFIRLGTDFNDNYYEYEIPLKVTPWGSRNESDIWPEYNYLDLEFDKLYQAKTKRNELLLDPNAGVSINIPYVITDFIAESGKKNIIRIKGNPNLSKVKTILIGVRNPKESELNTNDDGLAKCAEIWVNELRLSDFNNKGGWATIGRVTTNVADLGTATLSAGMSTPGWGSIEKKLNERQQETKQRYDLSTSVELGKFLPEQTKISVPMFYGVSEEWITPRYNPLDPDIEFKDFLQSEEITKEVKDSVKKRSETYQKIRSINFTNVRKEKAAQSKPHIYDVENLSLTYAYTETLQRDINTEYDTKKNYKGGIAYNFNANPKNYQPFKSSKYISKAKTLKWLHEFNFYLTPKQYSFQTNFDRLYNERQRRNNTIYEITLPTLYQKSFYWNRIYSLRHDFTKSLKFAFDATNNSVIGEPDGRVDKRYKEEYSEFKDSVIKSISTWGLNTQYRHNFSLDYNLPINKLPLLDFVTATARYTGSYDWKRAPIGADTLGHTIQNANSKQLNGQFNMVTLYNKVPYFKKLNSPQPKKPAPKPKPKPGEELKPEDKKAKEKEKKEAEIGKRIHDRFFKLMMGIKNISATYSEDRGTILPGYGRETKIMGFDPSFDAPGYNFIMGMQDPNYPAFAADKGWLTPNNILMYQYSNTLSKNLEGRMTIRPIESVRIELTANRRYAENTTRQFFWDDTQPGIEPFYNFNTPPTITGNYSVSFISWRTAFIGDDKKDYSSVTFKKLLDERKVVSERLGENNPNSSATGTGYFDGYGSTHQEVLINAFRAAYSGKSAKFTSLEQFPQVPLPNWRVTFDGLNKLDFFKKYFKNITVGHGYRSTYNVSSFTANLLYADDGQGNANAKDINNNFINQYQISTVSISEQFSPLINFDMSWNNSLLSKLELKTDRNISLSLNNNQITEVKGREIIIGAGYKFKDMRFPIKFGPDRKQPVSDFDLRADFSIRNNLTIIRKIVEESHQLTGGQRIISIKFTGDYRLSKNLNLRLFYDKVLTKPFISTTFPTANTNAGISLRFSLSQ
jgi:cell surface protein SprA